MGAAENAALIQRFYDEGWNANDLSVYDELVTPDFVDHQALPGLEPGREGFKMLNVMFRSAFPAVWVDGDQIVAGADTAAWRPNATQRPGTAAVPPRGARHGHGRGGGGPRRPSRRKRLARRRW